MRSIGMRQARESLDEEGLLIQQGEKLVKNPAANIEKDYQKIFWAGLRIRLGLESCQSSQTRVNDEGYFLI